MAILVSEKAAPKSEALTRQIIADMPPGNELGDPSLPGLRVRSTATGKKVFFYRYRARDGALRQIKLGEFGAMTLAEARKAVLKRKMEREQGIDPQLEKRRDRDKQRSERAAERQANYTVGDLIEQYIEEDLAKQKRGAEGERLLRRELLPKLGHRPATAITRNELREQVIRPVLSRAPRVATQLLSRIRCAYNHAAEQGRIPDDFVSPVLGLKGAAQVRRKRVLTDSELAVFMKWLPNSPYSRSIRDAISLMLCTGCRSGEIVAARWRDIDLDRSTWMILETKNGEPHSVTLPTQAVDLLKQRQGIDDVFVFPTPRGGKHIAQKAIGLAQYNARKDCIDPIEMPWTTHDLRRTVATGLARLGCPRVVQDRILNHVDNSVGAIYDRHRYDSEATLWLQRWANHVESLSLRQAGSIVKVGSVS